MRSVGRCGCKEEGGSEDSGERKRENPLHADHEIGYSPA